MKRMIGLLALLAAGIPALGEPQGKADDGKAPVEPFQVELEMQFVAFDSAVVEKLALKGDISAGSLTELWEAGKGRLIACPRLITRSGNEATVRGVQELIYPTDFHDYGTGEDTNQIASASEKVVPQNFETREVGAILSAIPEVSPEGDLVNLNLRPEWVALANWVDYGTEGGATNRMPLKQPVIYRVAVETQISLIPGTRVLLGGGVPGKDEGTLIYTFITCRLVNAEGKALKTLYSVGREPKAGEKKP